MILYKNSDGLFHPVDAIPPELQYLTDIEEMLISRVTPIMQVRHTRGRQLCYKDHIVNLPQDIAPIAEKLPRLPEELNMVIIRKDGVDMSRHVDFIVRRDKVRAALEYKIAHDPDYRDLVRPDEDALARLPEMGTVVDQIPTCREGRQADGVAQPAGPTEAAGEDEDGDLEMPVPGGNEPVEPVETFNGGVLNLGNGGRTEVDETRRAAEAVLGHAPADTIPPTQPQPQPRHRTPTYDHEYIVRLFPEVDESGLTSSL